MTTPNQSLPQTVETLLGFGAFEIGGGTYKYGQNLTEDIATTLIRGGSNLLIGAFTSVEGFLVALGAYLNTLPLEALQWMRQFIPGSVLADFDTISSAVATILGALHLDNLVMRAADFIAWIDATYHILETEVHQVLDAFTGAVITPITSRVADFLTWLNDLTGFRTIVDAAVATFTSNFAALISGVGGTVIGDVSSAIAAGVTALARIVSLITGVGGTTISDVVNFINFATTNLQGLLNILFDLFSFGSGSTGKTTANVASASSGFSSFITTLNTVVTQISDIFHGSVVTAVNSTVQQVKDWWTATGAALPDVAGAITNAIVNAGVTIGGTLEDAGSDLGDFLAESGANAQGMVNAVNNAAAGVTSGASTLLSVAATNLTAFLTSAPLFLQGLGGAAGVAATNAAYAAAAAQAAAHQQEITNQQSAFNAVFNVNPSTAGNVNVAVDFTPVANQSGMSGYMLPGTGSGAGFMGVTSGQAAWQGGTGTDIEVFPTQTVSDYQAIDVTLGSLNDLLSAGNTNVELWIPFRCNSSRTIFNYLRITLASGSVFAIIGAWVSGVNTQFAISATLSTIATGGKFRIIAGDPSSSSPYAMQILYNGTPILTYTDASHVVTVGSGQRYVALQGVSQVSGKYPPGVKTVTYQDNPPAPASYPYSGLPTAGTKGRQYWPNDVGLALRDNGTKWETVWGGVLGALTPPPSSSWSWVNQGGASTATEFGGERITAPTSTRNWRLRTRTLSPSSNYSASAFVEVAAAPVNAWYSGIGLRNSSSGSFITFGPALDATNLSHLAVYRWTNATTVSAAQFAKVTYTLPGGAIPRWYRIRDDGTNRYFDYSINGVDWINVYSEGRTTFITPDQFCFGATNESSGADLNIRLRSLAGIT